MKRALSICGLGLLLLIAVPRMDVAAGEALPAAVAGRLASLEGLVESSSGARRIQASGNPQARVGREEARRLLREARERYRAGDRAGGDRLSGQVSKTLFEAVRLAGVGAGERRRRQDDLRQRAERIEPLIEALERIAVEKGQRPHAAAVVRAARERISEGRRLGARGDLEAARLALDRGAKLVQTAIEGMRGGDTLVRTLHFETPEEEYRYELDRHATHKMLLQVLGRDGARSKGMAKMAQRFVERAETLRQQASEEAGAGDYAKAVKTLEAATKELVRAIRSAGVFIPG